MLKVSPHCNAMFFFYYRNARFAVNNSFNIYICICSMTQKKLWKYFTSKTKNNHAGQPDEWYRITTKVFVIKQ